MKRPYKLTPLHTTTKKVKKRKNNGERQNRQAFLLSGPIMLGMMLLGFVVYVGVMSLFTSMVQVSILDAITEVPTLHEYDKKTGKRISVISDEVQEKADPLLEERTRLNDEMGKLARTQVSNNFDFSVPLDNIQFDDNVADDDSNTVEPITRNDRLKAIKQRQNEINQELQDIGWHDQKSSKYAMYLYFAVPVTGALVLIIVFTAAVHFWEKGLQLFSPGTAMRMLKKSAYGIAIIWLFPELWDIFAILMTDFAVLMLDPINQQPQAVIDGLWCKMGAAAGCIFDFAGLLNPISWATALANPADFGQSLIGEILLPFFMMTPALTISLMVFVTSHIRILFINFMLISLPIWLLLMHVKYISSESDKFIHGMFGASLATFMSTLTLFIGWTYVSTTPIPSIEEWITVLGIISLAASWPITLAPIIGKAAQGVNQAVDTAVKSSSMMAMQIGMGAIGGGIKGAASGGGIKGILSGVAMGGASGGIGAMPRGISGDSMNSFKSGTTPETRNVGGDGGVEGGANSGGGAAGGGGGAAGGGGGAAGGGGGAAGGGGSSVQHIPSGTRAYQ